MDNDVIYAMLKEQLSVQNEQLDRMKKIHFWVKFWSVIAVISFIVSLVLVPLALVGAL